MRPSRARRAAARRADQYRLLARLPRHGVGAEVGVWKGDFSAAILKLNRPKTLYLIDPWAYREEPGFERAMYGGKSGGSARMDAVHDSVVARFEKQQGTGQVVILRQPS